MWNQHGALLYVLEPVCALVVYAICLIWISTRRGEWWEGILRTAILIGTLAAFADIVGLLIEDGLLFTVRGPALQIGVMLITFVFWGFAGWHVARKLHSSLAGLLASVFSAGVCAIIAVTAGFVIELLIAPPLPAYVLLWGEFKRSGWSDARAFGLANTLDSGFSHLTLSLVVAAVLGGLASMIARSRLVKPVAV